MGFGLALGAASAALSIGGSIMGSKARKKAEKAAEAARDQQFAVNRIIHGTNARDISRWVNDTVENTHLRTEEVNRVADDMVRYATDFKQNAAKAYSASSRLITLKRREMSGQERHQLVSRNMRGLQERSNIHLTQAESGLGGRVRERAVTAQLIQQGQDSGVHKQNIKMIARQSRAELAGAKAVRDARMVDARNVERKSEAMRIAQDNRAATTIKQTHSEAGAKRKQAKLEYISANLAGAAAASRVQGPSTLGTIMDIAGSALSFADSYRRGEF